MVGIIVSEARGEREVGQIHNPSLRSSVRRSAPCPTDRPLSFFSFELSYLNSSLIILCYKLLRPVARPSGCRIETRLDALSGPRLQFAGWSDSTAYGESAS
jgi:hypothetical protein